MFTGKLDMMALQQAGEVIDRHPGRSDDASDDGSRDVPGVERNSEPEFGFCLVLQLDVASGLMVNVEARLLKAADNLPGRENGELRTHAYSISTLTFYLTGSSRIGSSAGHCSPSFSSPSQ
jgi:hypothetical protein